MTKRFFAGLPRVSDALNGMATVWRGAAAFNPFTLHKRGQQGKALVALAVVCFFWGTTWVASKEGVRHLPALQLAGLRQTIAGLLYVSFFLARRTPLPKGSEWGAVVVLALLNFTLSNALSTWGVQYISAGLGSIIGAIFPLWLLIIARFGGESRISRKASVGLALGFSGICLIFYQHLQDFFKADFRLGIFLSLASTWSWAFGTLYTKKQAARFNPYFALGLQMLLSGPVVYLLSQVTGQAVPFAQIPWPAWTVIAYLVVFGSVLSFAAYLYALQHLPTEQVSLYAYINPVVALLSGALLFGEKLTAIILAGVAVTLWGVWLVNRASKL